ncbi:hypothetical protein JHK87_001495 [Glycine soja]|nr:hypothetical protein JHK87_001495 [Glycine soja]
MPIYGEASNHRRVAISTLSIPQNDIQPFEGISEVESFYICSEQDLGINENIMHQSSSSSSSFSSYFSQESNSGAFNQYGEGLEQLHRFLFVLGMTHVLYSCVVVGLAMSKRSEKLGLSLKLGSFMAGVMISTT